MNSGLLGCGSYQPSQAVLANFIAFDNHSIGFTPSTATLALSRNRSAAEIRAMLEDAPPRK
jgi:hypothetical protein